MTVPVPGSLTYSYDEDGVTTVFPYPVRFLEPQELTVIREVAGAQTVLAYNLDYTVSGAGNPSGGSITRTAVTDGGKIIIARSTAWKQIVDLEDKARNPAEAVELQMDRLTMAGQDVARRVGVVEVQAAEIDDAVRRSEEAAEAAESAEQAAEEAAEAAQQAAGSVQWPVSYGISQSLSTSQRLQAQANIGVRFVTPLMFGAVGDGVTDDTAALQACLAANMPIDWLGDDFAFRITDQITHAPTRPIQWIGKGARIVCDAPAAVYRTLLIDQLPAGENFIDDLIIDCQDKSYQGLRIISATSVRAFLAVRCHVISARRSGTAYPESASGIWISGDYRTVDVSGSSVVGCRLSAGAGVSGVAGAHGIVVRAMNGRPSSIIANGVYVEDVECDDLDYFADQDGMLVWTDRSANPDRQQDTSLSVSGAFFKNCLGRAIKSQVESASLEGIRVVRERGHTNNTVGVDIDLQIGGGRISGFSAVYDGVNSAPAQAVILGQSDVVGKPVAVGHLDGMEIAMSNGASMECAIYCGYRRGGKASYRASNVTIEGGDLNYVTRVAGGANAEMHVSMRGITAAPATSFVRATNGPASGSVLIDDIVNTGPSAVPAYTRQSASMDMRASVGFAVGIAENKNVTDNSLGAIERINALAPMGAGTTGVMRPVTFTLADGEQFLFPESFVNARSGILIITTSTHRNGHGIFTVDGSGIVPMHQSAAGSEFTLGTGSEPVSGNYRLWATTAGARLSNHSGSAKTFTCWMLG